MVGCATLVDHVAERFKKVMLGGEHAPSLVPWSTYEHSASLGGLGN